MGNGTLLALIVATEDPRFNTLWEMEPIVHLLFNRHAVVSIPYGKWNQGKSGNWGQNTSFNTLWEMEP